MTTQIKWEHTVRAMRWLWLMTLTLFNLSPHTLQLDFTHRNVDSACLGFVPVSLTFNQVLGVFSQHTQSVNCWRITDGPPARVEKRSSNGSTVHAVPPNGFMGISPVKKLGNALLVSVYLRSNKRCVKGISSRPNTVTISCKLGKAFSGTMHV